MIEKNPLDETPVAVPVDEVVRVAEQALAYIGTLAAGAGGGHVAERIVTLWREGKAQELAGTLEELRLTHAPPQVDQMAAALGGAVKLIASILAMQGNPDKGTEVAEWFRLGDFHHLSLAFEGLTASIPTPTGPVH